MPIDPDAGIPDLVRRLTDDSKRLAQDEVRLARLELRESLRDVTKGAVWLGVAFGAAVVALTAFTVFLSAGLGRLLGNYWAGTLVTAVLLLGGAAFAIKKGFGTIAEQELTLPETRESISETAQTLKAVKDTASQSVQTLKADLRGGYGSLGREPTAPNRSGFLERAD
jgi:uncharacterized membrane protein YqjE